MLLETGSLETQGYRGVCREQNVTPDHQGDVILRSLVWTMEYAHDEDSEQAHYVFLTPDVVELLRQRDAAAIQRQPVDLDLLRLADGCAEYLDEDTLA